MVSLSRLSVMQIGDYRRTTLLAVENARITSPAVWAIRSNVGFTRSPEAFDPAHRSNFFFDLVSLLAVIYPTYRHLACMHGSNISDHVPKYLSIGQSTILL